LTVAGYQGVHLRRCSEGPRSDLSLEPLPPWQANDLLPLGPIEHVTDE
jgi:hypothetical protein